MWFFTGSFCYRQHGYSAMQPVETQEPVPCGERIRFQIAETMKKTWWSFLFLCHLSHSLMWVKYVTTLLQEGQIWVAVGEPMVLNKKMWDQYCRVPSCRAASRLSITICLSESPSWHLGAYGTVYTLHSIFPITTFIWRPDLQPCLEKFDLLASLQKLDKKQVRIVDKIQWLLWKVVGWQHPELKCSDQNI